MKDNFPKIEIIIATFNSAKTLPLVLEAIRRQTYPRKNIKTFIVDGGSVDNTRKIAVNFGCQVIDNPKVFPAWAKYLGYKNAKSDYLMFLDSDEVIQNPNSLKRKIEVFIKNPNVHAVTGNGYITPEEGSFINHYINEFGDPFSCYVYNLSKDNSFFIKSMRRRYKTVGENSSYMLFDFSNTKVMPIFELVAMGSIVDLHYIKKNFPDLSKKPGSIPHLFQLLVSKGALIGIVKNDPLMHYSSSSLSRYLGKIRSRVMNNVFTSADEGFRGRERLSTQSTLIKKYLFLPYAFSIVFPLIDSIYYAITRKNVSYVIHLPLCLYTAMCIVWYMFLKMLHVSPKHTHYG